MSNVIFIVRFLLQIVFALAAAAIAYLTLGASAGQIASNLAFIAFCIFIILVLGPWWPSADKVAEWKRKLPPVNAEIAVPLSGILLGASALYEAWDTFTRPDQDFRRFEIVIAESFGSEGVAWMWVAIGLGFFWGTWHLRKRLRAQE